MELSIKDILRAGHVHRWQIVRTAREQTLAEHLFAVAMISIRLAEELMGDELSDSDKYHIYNWALHHDLPEIYLGDIATPVKAKMKEVAGRDVMDKIERGISEEFSIAKDSVRNTEFKIIVKMADIIDAVSFLNTEGLGSHAELVIDKLHENFNKCIDFASNHYPDIEWEKAVDFYDTVISGKDGILDFEFRGF